MKTFHRLVSGAVAVAVLLPVVACSSSPETEATSGPIKIGFITKFPVAFYSTMVDAAKAYDAAHDDVEIVFGQGKSGTDDESAIGFIEDMIAQKVKAIAITPTSPNVQSALDKAVKAGIKVVLIDNDIPGWTGKSTVVATDNLAGGKLAGAWLAGQLAPGAPIAILQGRLGTPSLDDRVKGMKEALGDRAKVVTEMATDCDQDKGFNSTLDILATHPEVVAIYSACGPPITGAIKAIKGVKKKKADITLVGFDASPEEVAAIGAGEQAGSVAQFPAKMGTAGVEAAVAVARGQSVPPSIDTGTEMVTKSNVAKFQ
jgi:simple sugar transport system substrate-binding protein